MSKGKATFKQRDLERAMRAAKAFGISVVEVTPDGTIRIIPPEQYYASADGQTVAIKKHKKMY